MRDISHLETYYDGYDEAGRLASRVGQVEFRTTMRYIERYLRPGMRVLEIGAGTGRYSHALAQAGTPVDAIELVQANIDIFRQHTQPGEPVTIRQGDALDLSAIPDDTYDITLCLGPMYHLYTEAEKLRALSEALRVTRPGGLLYTAYCMSDPSIMDYGFGRGNIHALLEKGLVDPETFRTTTTPAELFELCRKEDIDALNAALPATRLHFVATDLFTRYFRDTIGAMDDETYALYLTYHFSICERPDMAGISHHTLDIVRKEA